jgi:small subunit ribosomal protein S16
MAARIRLRRMGTKKKPAYRIVVVDPRFPRDGRFIEVLGHYNPRTNPMTLEVHEEKAKDWLSKGALPSETVYRLFALKGLLPPLKGGKQS